MSLNSPHVLILAAGKGKRMRSALPKVLHPVLGQPMLHHIIDTVLSVAHQSIGVVVGHGEGDVKTACENYAGIHYFSQKQQLGTGDAVRITEDFYSGKAGALELGHQRGRHEADGRQHRCGLQEARRDG